jgi:Kef-type K+ transport system membrane component KefB
VLLGTVLAVGEVDWQRFSSLYFLAEIGVLLLLFEVGLETSVEDIRKAGSKAALVAVVGVILPMILGYVLSWSLEVADTWLGHLFLGATLAATSVGITARVLKDLGKASAPESAIILGAAVIDDVLGLVILGVISALAAQGVGESTVASALLLPLAKAVFYFAAAYAFGRFAIPPFLRFCRKEFGEPGLILGGLCICLLFGFAAQQCGLAPVVGAFFAGMMTDTNPGAAGHGLEHSLKPLLYIFVPLFFVLTGMGVDLRLFAEGSALFLTLMLCVVAVAGKLAAGFVLKGGRQRWIVGVGMVPRGEVGLIFAALGAALQVDGAPLLSQEAYVAVVAMVAFTTFLAPTWLTLLYRKRS